MDVKTGRLIIQLNRSLSEHMPNIINCSQIESILYEMDVCTIRFHLKGIFTINPGALLKVI